MPGSLRQTLIFSALLALLGGGIFFIKVSDYNYPLTPGLERTVWDFEIYLEFMAKDEPARIEVFIPTADKDRRILEEQFFNGPFGLSFDKDSLGQNRQAVWTYRYPNNLKVLRYKGQVTGETLESELSDSLKRPRRREEGREPDAVKRQAFIVWRDDVRRRSADDRSFVVQALNDIFDRDRRDRVAPLLPDLPAPMN